MQVQPTRAMWRRKPYFGKRKGSNENVTSKTGPFKRLADRGKDTLDLEGDSNKKRDILDFGAKEKTR